MPYFLDAVQMTVAGAPGTGTITLGVAVAGYQTFASAGVVDGQKVSYAIQDVNGAYEYGRGTYTSSGTALARTTVIGSSNGNAAISATAAAIVSSTALAEDIAPVPYLRDYLGGMILSNDGTSPLTVLDVSAGTCSDSASAVLINIGAFTKSTGGSWTAGTGSNGMGTGLTITTSTWYHVFAIMNAGAADIYFDTSVTAVNAPAGTTAHRRIGSFLTDGSSHIVAFSQNGDEFLWLASSLDVNGTALGTTATLFALTVPLGVKVNALFNAGIGGVATIRSVLFNSPDQTSVTPASGAGVANISMSVASIGVSGQFNIRTNTSQQIRAVCDNNSGVLLYIGTSGWIDTRGRFA
jgi:hypothetical protein